MNWQRPEEEIHIRYHHHNHQLNYWRQRDAQNTVTQGTRDGDERDRGKQRWRDWDGKITAGFFTVLFLTPSLDLQLMVWAPLISWCSSLQSVHLRVWTHVLVRRLSVYSGQEPPRSDFIWGLQASVETDNTITDMMTWKTH